MFKLKQLFLNATDEGGGGGGGVTITPEIQAVIDQQVAGLKTKNAELLGSLRTTKTELEGFKTQFEGLDIDAVKGLLNKVGQDEETRLLAEGKLDEVITKRTERLRTDYDKQLAAEKTRADKAEAFAAKYSDKVLADSIRAAAIKAGALPEAAEDIILRARGTFKLSEDGEAIATDRDGEVVYGKDGKTPLSPLEWAESLRETATHLWPRAQGAGQTGDNGGKATKKWGDHTEQERAVLARDNPEAYKRLKATQGT
ncbi:MULTISPECIES: hypothetical protein [Pseudomonas syringae group]|uniref:Phage protein n=2 Tax=unclassified bacterial viruses TaxID=12333 RepID=A0AAU6W5A8_9VIRU|nr:MULTISPECIES: hypothetical protein [Pseudomonas syringae group]EEB61241.1 hypothetical protein PSPTOT1_3736 [Pseudomonas syringae pv. tomato T1]KPW37458.1 Uncharacterized protein ALO87_01146 [Pseudomonas syringae pv. apii]MBI6841785.1 hypothetical protein [Pseudomonas syringae]MBM1212557.1 hypothetical protein [Pseudomonas syringae]MBM1218297.1 hypothetical protein [Pseudomonas syringae]